MSTKAATVSWKGLDNVVILMKACSNFAQGGEKNEREKT